MSKPKHSWYGEVKRRIMEGKWRNPESFQDWLYYKAIFEAREETLKLPNGELRLKAVDDILIHKLKTYDGEALEVNYGRDTIQKWVTSFVNLVGRKAGN